MTVEELIELLMRVPDKSAPVRLIHIDAEVFEFTQEIDYSSEETTYLEIK